MTEATAHKNGEVRELSREESRALFDRQAQRYLNVSGEEFIRKFEAGEYGDPDDNPAVMRLVMLLPFAK